MKKPTKRESEILDFLESLIQQHEPTVTFYKHTTEKIVAQEKIESLLEVKRFITGEVKEEKPIVTSNKNPKGWIGSGTELR